MERALLHLLQTSDSAFPVGGFTHSQGLEGMVQAGLVEDASTLAAFIENTWQPAMTAIDLPLIRHAAAAAGDDDRLFAVDEIATACRATAEIRKALKQMGRQRLALVAKLTGHPDLARLDRLAAKDRWNAGWPVVWGAEAAHLDLPLPLVIPAYMYQSLAGLLTAALKLIRIGPTESQTLLYRFASGFQQATESAADIPLDEIGWFSPMLDIQSARHEHAYSRIFIS